MPNIAGSCKTCYASLEVQEPKGHGRLSHMTKLCIWMLAALLPLTAAQDNPAAGTWKLDVAKSKFSPGPPPKSATLTIEAQGDSVKTKLDEVEAGDSHTGYEYTASLDGKDYPLAGSSGPERLRGADAVILRRKIGR